MKFYQSHQYQPKCIKLFKNHHEVILNTLPNAQIEHIGASAIPNYISKGDLDIYVAVEDQHHNVAIKSLEKLGFKTKPDALKTVNLCMLEDENVAIQLVVKDSEFESFLKLPEALLASPLLVERYNQIKLGCVNVDMEQYRQLKSKFIERVLSQ